MSDPAHLHIQSDSCSFFGTPDPAPLRFLSGHFSNQWRSVHSTVIYDYWVDPAMTQTAGRVEKQDVTAIGLSDSSITNTHTHSIRNTHTLYQEHTHTHTPFNIPFHDMHV